VAGQVLPGRAALQDAGRTREEPDLVHQRREFLGHREGDRLAGVAALGGHDLPFALVRPWQTIGTYTSDSVADNICFDEIS
jgi:hypothetical protein